jgi:hypothetical protein
VTQQALSGRRSAPNAAHEAARLDPALRPAPGRYRLAAPDKLRGIRLPLSILVISHQGAGPIYGLRPPASVEEGTWDLGLGTC